jgi:hypothetical protein
VLDGDGIIRWSYCSPIDVNPGADGILNALEMLTPRAVSADATARAPERAPSAERGDAGREPRP